MNNLAEETPFAAVVNKQHRHDACSSCFVWKGNYPSVSLSRCGGCRVLQYCSKECQKKDWADHKGECHLLRKWAPRVPPMLCRLIARIIFKLKKSDANKAAFNGRRYEDLMDHREKIQKDTERMKSFATCMQILREYMCDKLAPEPEVLSIFGKISINSFSVGDPTNPVGSGLYIGLSAQNHSCDPDGEVYFDGTKAMLRSSRVKEYSTDVTISYVDLLFSNRRRQEKLNDEYYFTCTCSVCSNPKREFLENSVLSTCCPDSYCLLDPSASQLTCFKCGKPSNITVEQAISANKEVKLVCEPIDHYTDPFSPLDIPIVGPELTKKYSKHLKVLSPCNLNLLHVADRIFNLAYQIGNYRLCAEFVDRILAGYTCYLDTADPLYVAHLVHSAKAMCFGGAPAAKALKIVKLAQQASRLAFGPQHKNQDLDALESRCRTEGMGQPQAGKPVPNSVESRCTMGRKQQPDSEMNTLAEETPFAAVVNDHHLYSSCSSCFTFKGKDPSVTLSRCGGCRVLQYCSKVCQKKDWADHKDECNLLKKCSPRVPPWTCRLVARIIFKLERSDANDAAFNGRRYEDLMDHVEEMANDPSHISLLAETMTVLQEYMCGKVVTAREVLTILGKLNTNSFGIGKCFAKVGYGLYIGLSVHNHNCDPDAYVVFDGRKAIMRSSSVKKYSKDVTINYLFLMLSKRNRQNRLLESYYFTCTCAVCSDPTKEFLENSVVSTCCPESYCLLDPSASKLSCFKCGTPSNITMEQANSANEAIRLVCEKIDNESALVPAPDSPASIRALIKEYEKLSKILSPYNLELLKLTDEIFRIAYQVGDFPLAVKYVDQLLAAYKRYMRMGDPIFTRCLLYFAMALNYGYAPIRKTMQMVELAREASRLTFGPQHKIPELDSIALKWRMEGMRL